MLIRICACCLQPKEAHTFAAEGPLCGTCVGRASTRVETIWIDGQRFNITRKGIGAARQPAIARTA